MGSDGTGQFGLTDFWFPGAVAPEAEDNVDEDLGRAYAEFARDVLNRVAEGRSALSMLNGRNAASARQSRSDARVVERLGHYFLDGDESSARDLIRQQMEDGLSADAVQDRLLSPACCELGRMWDEDNVGFFRMTVGIGSVYAMLRWLRSLPVEAGVPAKRALGICLASVPGETHTIGLTMAADRLRRDGWDIDVHVGMGQKDLLAAIVAGGYTVVALSAATAQHLEPLARLVTALDTLRPRPQVLLCGAILERVEGIASRLGTGMVRGSGAEAISDMNRQLEDLADAWQRSRGEVVTRG